MTELLGILKCFLLGIICFKCDECANWLSVFVIVKLVRDLLVYLLVKLQYFFVSHRFDHLTPPFEKHNQILIIISECDIADMHFELWVDVRVEDLFEHLGGLCIIIELYKGRVKIAILI